MMIRILLVLLGAWCLAGATISQPAFAKGSPARPITRDVVPNPSFGQHASKPSLTWAEYQRILTRQRPVARAGQSLRPRVALQTGSSSISCPGGASEPDEIAALAYGLKCNTDLIFEWVYNNIEFEPTTGSNKGPLGTLLDGSGNDFDQAQLFVALLYAAGVSSTSINYQYGSVSVPVSAPSGITAGGWLGILGTDGYAISQTFINAGVPSKVDISGSIEKVDVAHLWVQVQIGGTWYVFDPSLKQHTVTSAPTSPTLASILGYKQTQFLADAGGTLGSQNYSITAPNRAIVRNDLVTYANNLVSYIKTQNPVASLATIIGGKSIQPLTGSPIRSTSQQYLCTYECPAPVSNLGATIPSMYRTCFTISFQPTVSPKNCANATNQNVVLYADQTYGQRITIFSTPDPAHAGNYIPTLLVDGTAPSGITTGPSVLGGNNWTIDVCITQGTTTSQCTNNASPAPVALTIAAGGSYVVAGSWGLVGRGMIEKHRKLLAQAIASGSASASEPVLGESLSVIFYSYVAELSASARIGGQMGGTIPQFLHTMGVTGQRQIQSTSSQGPYVDLAAEVQNSPESCDNTTCPAFPISTVQADFGEAGVGSSLESAVLNQTQAPTPNMMAASTIDLIDSNVAAGGTTYFADGTTCPGQTYYEGTIRPIIDPSSPAPANYAQSDVTQIDTSVTGQTPPPGTCTPTSSQVLIPSSGNIAIGLWNGAGYTTITKTSSIVSITQGITGGFLGGFGGVNIPAPTLNSNAVSTMPTPPQPTQVTVGLVTNPPAATSPRVSEPIDAIGGAEIYNHNDLTVGSGAFPYAIPFSRTYRSSSQGTDIGIGEGWTHSYDINVQSNSDPYQGMGDNSPISAAQAIAALYVSQDLLTTASTNLISPPSPPSSSPPQVQLLTVAALVHRWFTDQLTNNALLVSRPDTTEEFLALPHADSASTIAYNPPLGSAVLLTGLSSGYTYQTKDRQLLTFGAAPSGNITSWAWPNGLSVTFNYGYSYNGTNYLSTLSNNLGRTLTLSYTGAHVTSVGDGTGRSVTYGYDGNNNLTTFTDPLSFVTSFSYDTSGSYDTAGHLTQIFYPSAPTNPYMTNYYDAVGRVAKQANALGNLTNLYFAGSRTETIDAAQDHHVTYQTARGKVTLDASILNNAVFPGPVFSDTAQNNGVINVTSNQYDAQDRLTLATAPEGGTTGYTYSPDLEQNVTAITQTPKPGSPLMAVSTSFAYDPVYNKPTLVTDPTGLKTTMAYDPATGNMLSTIADAGVGHLNATTLFTYNSVGQVLTTTDPLGTVTKFAYDGFGNQVSVTRDYGRLNNLTSFAYSSVGDVTSATDPNGNVTTSTYDLDRRLTSQTTPPASIPLTTTFTYDQDSHLLQTQRSAGGTVLQTTSATYTLTGKVATSTDPNGNITHNTYDSVDRLSSVTDPLGNVTNIGYDALSRKLTVSNPAIQANPLITQAYTPDGLLASVAIARSNSVADTTSYTYDGFDRLGTATYPDASTESYTYDADSNILTRKTRKGDTIAFAYDTLNRECTKTYATSPVACGGTSSNYLASYAYDLLGHVTQVSDNGATIHVATTAASYVENASYDALNRPVSYTWSPAAAQTTPTASTSSFTFSYDANNRRVGETATDDSWWSYPTTASSTSYTANTLNQYSAVGSVSPSYDGNGNLTYDGTYTYCYDAESHLTSIVSAGSCASPTTTVARYAYDAQGRRKSKTVGSTTTLYVTDADNREVLEYDGTSGATQRWYSFGQGPDAALNQMNVAAGTRATLIPDTIGSLIGSLSSSGTLTKTGYQTFGENPSLSSSATPGFYYTGRRLDPETAGSTSEPSGIYYYRSRMYSPTLGRFFQPDPIGYAGGYNLYAYVGNDPLNNTDPSGNCGPLTLNCIGGAIGGVGGLISGGLAGYHATGTLEGTLIGAGAGAVVGGGIGFASPIAVEAAISAGGAAGGSLTVLGLSATSGGASAAVADLAVSAAVPNSQVDLKQDVVTGLAVGAAVAVPEAAATGIAAAGGVELGATGSAVLSGNTAILGALGSIPGACTSGGGCGPEINSTPSFGANTNGTGNGK